MLRETMTSEAESAEMETSYESGIASQKKNTFAKIAGVLTGTVLVVGFHALQGFAGSMADQERDAEALATKDAIAQRQAEEAEVRTARSKIAWAGGPAVVVDRNYNDSYRVAHLIDHDKGESE